MAHTPVLLREVLDALDLKPGQFVIDGTIDGGGHAEAMLDIIGKEGMLLGIDQDPAMLALSKERFAGKRNVLLEEGSYADLADMIATHKLPKADAVLLDLGFSSNQLMDGRGFSFSKNEPLTMTYSPKTATVAEILRGMREQELSDIIYEYGGERMSRRIARAIVDQSRKGAITTTGELATIVRSVLPRSYERGRIDPATRTFQALRIYANRELDHVKNGMERIPEIMKSGGRVAIITFHSLEDRIVKQGMQLWEKEGKAKKLTKKPIEPTDEEAQTNPRSRSAKLRSAIFNTELNHDNS
jgi:16S rRNA (cytosine1402-N4)-methyltransferase